MPAAFNYDAFIATLQGQFGDGLVTVVGSGLSCAGPARRSSAAIAPVSMRRLMNAAFT